jgi:hypothetical protein
LKRRQLKQHFFILAEHILDASEKNLGGFGGFLFGFVLVSDAETFFGIFELDSSLVKLAGVRRDARSLKVEAFMMRNCQILLSMRTSPAYYSSSLCFVPD